MKKYLFLFLTIILLSGCGSKSENNGERRSDMAAEREAVSNNRIDSGRSQAGKLEDTEEKRSESEVTTTSQSGFWRRIIGPEVSRIHCFVIDSAGHFFIGTDRGIFRSTDHGKQWAGFDGVGGKDVYFVQFQGMKTLALPQTACTVQKPVDTNRYSAVAINVNGYLFAVSGRSIYRSTDNGESWTNVNEEMKNSYVSSVVVHGDHEVFAVTPEGLYHSHRGEGWTKMGEELGNIAVSHLAFNDSGHIFAGTYGHGVYRSKDNGKTWSSVNSGFTREPSIFSLVTGSNGHVLALTNYGVFHASDNGANWREVTNGLKYDRITSIALDADGHLLACAEGYGIFRTVEPAERFALAKTVELSREKIFDRRLRELYAGQPVSTKYDYAIINRGKSAQHTAIMISRPRERDYDSRKEATRDTVQATWQNDLASLPFLSEEISARFKQHGLRADNLVSLRVVDLWKVREAPLTVVLNLWLETELHEAEKSLYDPDFYCRQTYLSVIAVERQSTWQLQVLSEAYDEVTCDDNGSDNDEIWDVADLDDDGNNEIILLASTCSECIELRVYAIGSDGNYSLAYAGGGYGL